MGKAFAVKFLMIALSVILSNNGYAQQSQPGSCINAKCHATMGKAKFVHGPVAAEECTPCHTPKPGEKHKFALPAKAEQLCVTCHEPMKRQTVVHAPVASGSCTSCHDPHQSVQRFFLKKESLPALCSSCHPTVAADSGSVHFPVAQGECLSCHQVHSSARPKLLSKEGNEVCFECHGDVKDALAAAKHVHKPVSDRCTSCHNPHSGKGPLLLASTIEGTCRGCHRSMDEHLKKAVVPHRAVDTGKACVNCHAPHESPVAQQLKDEPMKLCLSCHNQTLPAGNGDQLANMQALFSANPDWHGPIRERDCSGCHDVHGSANFRILKMNYPREFYSAFSTDQYELCFSCHEPSLVQDAATTTLTGFRDGEKNMHYLHVNRAVKGRTCRSCHETHASQKEKHIRDRVPFGQWSLPIRYEKRPDGGKCSPGCHAPKEYSRGKSLSGGASK